MKNEEQEKLTEEQKAELVEACQMAFGGIDEDEFLNQLAAYFDRLRRSQSAARTRKKKD